MSYTPDTRQRIAMPEFARRFRTAFPDLGSANLYLDRLLSAATLTPCLDTFALEDAIVAKHGEIPDGTSLEQTITARYGPAASAFVREVL